jgi:hypothetical protein
MADAKTGNTEGVIEVTEEDLMKSLKEVAGTAPDPDKTPEKKVVFTRLTKSFQDTLKEKASPEMVKALELSPFLQEFAGIVGSHVDGSLEQLTKSINGAAERDMVTVEALVALKKSIDDNTAAVQKFGEQPGAAAAAAAVTVGKDELLTKSIATDGKTVDGQLVKKNILKGLEALAKSHKPGTPEQSKWSQTLVRFESTNQITNADLAAAREAFTKPPQAVAA